MFCELFCVLFSALVCFPEKKPFTNDKTPALAEAGDKNSTEDIANEKTSLPAKSLKNNAFFVRHPPKPAGKPESFELREISLF